MSCYFATAHSARLDFSLILNQRTAQHPRGLDLFQTHKPLRLSK